MKTCCKPDCNEPRMVTGSGRELTMCVEHQREYWRSRPTTDKPSYQTAHQRQLTSSEPSAEKTCAKCGKTKPLAVENFHPDGRSRDGFSKLCRECVRSTTPAAKSGKPTKRHYTEEEVAAMRAPVPPVAPLGEQVPVEAMTLVLIDPDTDHAVLLDCIPRPLLYRVPADNAEFSRQVSAAQRRGHIVAFRMSLAHSNQEE